MASELITKNIFSKVLLEPANNSSDLYIVSGYASSTMASYHAEILKEQEANINVHLIIGMTSKNGLSVKDHIEFKNLMENELPGRFECSYLINHYPVHSKVYSWLHKNEPIRGFLGSANYSQQAFIINHQGEVASECNSLQAYEYYQSLIDNTLFCTHQDVEEEITMYDNRIITSNQNTTKAGNSTAGLEKVTITLVNNSGMVSASSGLNWGQRSGREPNQAYIPLKSEVCNTDFFPPIGQHFTINTDDGKILICTRAQQNGKAIHTPLNNSQIGEYFRNRLNVANGELVIMADLTNYGRTDIDFYKVDEENYFMDFSLPE